VNTSTISDLADTVSDTVADAVSTGVEVALDVAGAIAARAPDVAEAVSRNAADLVDRVSSTPRRRWRPVLLVLLVVVGAVVTVKWMKGRRSSAPATGVNDLREHTDRARAAAS
jgi:hypothetical protein